MLALAVLVLPLLHLSEPVGRADRANAALVRGDEPPPGPPWQLSYRAARREALRTGRPIFAYFTKTY